MFKILSGYLSHLNNYAKRAGIFATELKTPFLWILGIYVTLAILPFIAAFVFLMITAIVKDKPDIDAFIKLGSTIISAPAITFVAFIAGFIIDNNNDGIPDHFQSDGKYSGQPKDLNKPDNNKPINIEEPDIKI